MENTIKLSIILCASLKVAAWWTNFPYNCTQLVDENPNVKCGYDNYHYSLKDLSSYKNLINMGKICSYKPELGNTINGFICKKIVRYTSCYQDAEGNNLTTYKTDLEETTQEDCEVMLKKRMQFGYDQQMFYPPAQCSYLRNTTTETIFYIIDQVEIYDDPFQEPSHRLYEISGKSISDIRLVGVKPWSSESCQVDKWECINSDTDIFLDMIKPGNWINLHFIFLQFQILYEHTFGTVKFRSICKIKFCGMYMLYTRNYRLFHIENENIINRFDDCEQHESIRLSNVKGIIGSEFGVNAIKFKLEDKERYCEEMKSKLENSGTVNYNNMHYMSPIYPGVNLGYALKEYLSTFGSVLTGKTIKQNKLSFFSCNYWPTEFRTYNDSGKKILFHRRMGESTFTSEELDIVWSHEKILPNERFNNSDGKIKFGINGIISNNGTLLIPNSRILSMLFKNLETPLNKTLNIKEIKGKKIKLEDLMEFSEKVEVVDTHREVESNEIDDNNQTDSVNIIGQNKDEEFNLTKSLDNFKNLKRNITITKNKNIIEGFDLDVTTWGLLTLSSIITLLLLYKKLKDYKSKKKGNN
ncbi:non-structural glycoprotein [Koolpinyah virus]|uniref:Non-structural glycoprotein n=1 Tax=Koolpinyah virus TaxID=1550518 RepID=A0A096ZGT2_9RHAB|nr:non-structural glycoprotein [Koolpinyah virus]AIR95562.1 non-structural glycoprotein [Koolpinyah virus]